MIKQLSLFILSIATLLASCSKPQATTAPTPTQPELFVNGRIEITQDSTSEVQTRVTIKSSNSEQNALGNVYLNAHQLSTASEWISSGGMFSEPTLSYYYTGGNEVPINFSGDNLWEISGKGSNPQIYYSHPGGTPFFSFPVRISKSLPLTLYFLNADSASLTLYTIDSANQYSHVVRQVKTNKVTLTPADMQFLATTYDGRFLVNLYSTKKHIVDDKTTFYSTIEYTRTGRVEVMP
jgi:hypothetical protein